MSAATRLSSVSIESNSLNSEDDIIENSQVEHNIPFIFEVCENGSFSLD